MVRLNFYSKLPISNDITLNMSWVYGKQRVLSDERIYVNQKVGLPLEFTIGLCAWHCITQNAY